MDQTSQASTERSFDDLTFDVARVRGGPYFGPSDLRPSTDQTGTQKHEQDPCSVRPDPAEVQARLNTLVNACGAGDDQSSFRKHKEQLITDLASPYALFYFVKAHAEVADLLRGHEALKDRVRKIPATKTALLSIYCKMHPTNSDERKSCSDWTIWLEQAYREKVEPSDFIAWGMEKNFRECRDEVRAHRNTAKMSDSGSAVRSDQPLRLSLRQTATGASVTLRGQTFIIPTATMKKVIITIERAAPKGVIDFSNDNEGSDTDA